MTENVKNTEATEALGARLALTLVNSGKDRAFIALFGEMGVGKTAFVRGFCSYLDISGVRSPTYTIVNEYRGRVRVFHFDLYRIEDPDDLESIGFDDYVRAKGYCISEWSERIPDEIPDDAIRVTISRVADRENERNVEILGINI